MKKILVFVLLICSIVLVSCKEEETVEVVGEYELLGTHDFVVDEIQAYEYMDGEWVYIYKDIIGLDKNKKPIYNMVSSKLVYEIGDEIKVLDIYLEENGFDYSVIQLENGALDTSWHTYLEVI